MKIVVHPKYHNYRDFITQIPAAFYKNGDTIYKGRNIVKRFINDKNEWIIKKYKRPNIIQQLVYTFFKKSKAERAYLFAEKLLAAGIATPEGVAYIEEKRYGLIRDCYFISTSCLDPAVYPILVETDNYDRELASNLAAFFVQLHSKGILHGDPNLNNILYHKSREGIFLFSVIDTNRSIFKSSLTKQDCLNNLKRVTHRRDLLQYITKEYAKLRKWDIQDSVSRVMKALDRFEKLKKIRRLIKGKK